MHKLEPQTPQAEPSPRPPCVWSRGDPNANLNRPGVSEDRYPAPTTTAHGLSKAANVPLTTRFSNLRAPVKALISRGLRGQKALTPRADRTPVADLRGAVRENVRFPQTRLRPTQMSELLAGYEAGTPVTALAEQFGVHRVTVSQAVRRAGITRRCASVSQAQRIQAAALYAEGCTLVQAAQQAGINYHAVRAAVIAEGGRIRPRGRRR